MTQDEINEEKSLTSCIAAQMSPRNGPPQIPKLANAMWMIVLPSFATRSAIA